MKQIIATKSPQMIPIGPQKYNTKRTLNVRRPILTGDIPIPNSVENYRLRSYHKQTTIIKIGNSSGAKSKQGNPTRVRLFSIPCSMLLTTFMLSVSEISETLNKKRKLVAVEKISLFIQRE